MSRIAIWTLLAFNIPLALVAEDAKSASNEAPNFREVKTTQPISVTYESIREGSSHEPRYWIGLSCASVDETLRAQLGLSAGTGLVIRQVAERSPASTAGLQVHDVITKVQVGTITFQPTGPDQFASIVQQAEFTSMILTLLHAGKLREVVITPEPRKATETTVKSVTTTSLPDEITRNTTTYPGTVPLPQPFVFRMTGPVVTLNAQPTAISNLPDNITVTIVKTGTQPAKFTVQQQDRGEWTIKESETAIQPDHITQAVADMLAGMKRLIVRRGLQQDQPTCTVQPRPAETDQLVPTAPYWLSTPGATSTVGPIFAHPQSISPSTTPPDLLSVQRQLDELLKQQDQLVKGLNELRQSLPPSNTHN